VFTARYALSPYIKQIRFVFKGLIVLASLGYVMEDKMGEALSTYGWDIVTVRDMLGLVSLVVVLMR
jgi:hypothetical protein